MRPTVEFKIVYDRLPEWTRDVERQVDLIIAKTCFDVLAAARAAAPVGTGALKNSGYAATPDRSDYQQAVAEARAAWERGGRRAAAVDPEAKPRRHQGIVHFPVEYAKWVELTVKQFLGPAVERYRRPFLEAMRRVVG